MRRLACHSGDQSGYVGASDAIRGWHAACKPSRCANDGAAMK